MFQVKVERFQGGRIFLVLMYLNFGTVYNCLNIDRYLDCARVSEVRES